MKCILILAIVAISTATPFIGVDVKPSVWGSDSEAAHHVTQKALHDQLAHTDEAIKDLQRQLHEGYYYGTGGHQYEKATGAVDALHYLQEDLRHQQGTDRDVIQQSHDTVETSVEAEIASADVHRQQATHGLYSPAVGHGVAFQAKLQKLVDEHHKQEINKQIDHHHHWAQQLHEQQQFVNQQKRQIEAQKVGVQQQGDQRQVEHLDAVHRQLHQQECHLIQEQLAHHLAELQLQKALVQKEQEILRDTVEENAHEEPFEHQSYKIKHWSF